MTEQIVDTAITLKGSIQIISEFFEFAINNVLYMRGLYPSESFKFQKKYNQRLPITIDQNLSNYLQTVLNQLNDWLQLHKVQCLVLVIISPQTNEALERWTFNIEYNETAIRNNEVSSKTTRELTLELQALMRQLNASSSYLPLLEDGAVFDLLIYTNPDTETPKLWEVSDAKEIKNAQLVSLRTIDTKIHKVRTAVAYTNPDQ
eukprot:TRINITY_DN2164_c0_g1_i1.p1 TRINITY_DN2164_c0_g1~~TRINITY_DN2164_c0_g1_i1.p1  ORF type:complete len:204 (+),score=48.83 TRINITY_DN2164_c0_g1_i1:76-687(+)